MTKPRSIALGALLIGAGAAALTSCAARGRNGEELRQTSWDGDEHVPDRRPPPPPRRLEDGPPTEATCDAEPPRDGCHWTLVSTSYCGGVEPPPQRTWPHCSCERCAVDADCGDGEKCDTLAPEGECPNVVRICVHPSRSACTSTRGCPTGLACNAVDGKPACRPIVMYPDRP